MLSPRLMRRNLGFLSNYFSPHLLQLGQPADGRSKQGRRWKKSSVLLQATLLALASGCKGLTEAEILTASMSVGSRRQFGIAKRVPDTTLRTFLCKLNPYILATMIHVVAYDAWRRKALQHRKDLSFLPFGVLSMDGKYPSVRDVGDSDFLQVRHDEDGHPTHGLVRTVTSCLVSAIGRPLLGATPIRGDTNEQGSFANAFGEMVQMFGALFTLVMYDAGAASQKNADLVIDAKKDYFFQVADARWTMHQMMVLLFKDKAHQFSEEKTSGEERVVRQITVLPVKKTRKNLTMWSHVQAAVRVYSETYKEGKLTGTKTRYFVTSLPASKFTPQQFLELVILRWGVETVHQILDIKSAYEEDRRPWITSDAQGNLNVQLLRRVVFTLTTLYKHVTLRSDENRNESWGCYLKRFLSVLQWSTPELFVGLRRRTYAVPPAML
ncbi:MAG: transposase [Myxococcota bacterium]